MLDVGDRVFVFDYPTWRKKGDVDNHSQFMHPGTVVRAFIFEGRDHVNVRLDDGRLFTQHADGLQRACITPNCRNKPLVDGSFCHNCVY